MNLLIVESPSKVKTIQSFFDKEQILVTSSVGHIRDLSIKGQGNIGVDLKTMLPDYVNLKGKRKVIESLQDLASQSTKIYLAMDPDREGESIAWHIKEVLGDKYKYERVVFNEITKEAVTFAVDNPTTLDDKLIGAQESRRILDRIVGFKLSSLARKSNAGHSAGRVKSAALKLIIDQEKIIKDFIPEYWYSLSSSLEGKDISVVDKYNKKVIFETKEDATDILKTLGKEFKHSERVEQDVPVKRPRPFEMSSLLQQAYLQLKLSNKAATYALQKLYENGLITYPRTDSTRISSANFIDEIKSLIETKYNKDAFAGLQSSTTGKTTQNAHEAIRPTSILQQADSLKNLTPTQINIYKLIWERTMMSFMSDGKDLIIKDLYKNKDINLMSKSKITIHNGFRDVKSETSTGTPSKIVSVLKISDVGIIETQHKSQNPKRYNQSSIIKKLKTSAIGRPSTYGGIIDGLKKFGFVEIDKTGILPTELAFKSIEFLEQNFLEIVETGFTQELELSLDQIANGKLPKKDFLLNFYDWFEKKLEVVSKSLPKSKPKTALVKLERPCPTCKSDLVWRTNSKDQSKFVACSAFPKCRYTESTETTKELDLLSQITPQTTLQQET